MNEEELNDLDLGGDEIDTDVSDADLLAMMRDALGDVNDIGDLKSGTFSEEEAETTVSQAPSSGGGVPTGEVTASELDDLLLELGADEADPLVGALKETFSEADNEVAEALVAFGELEDTDDEMDLSRFEAIEETMLAAKKVEDARKSEDVAEKAAQIKIPVPIKRESLISRIGAKRVASFLVFLIILALGSAAVAYALLVPEQETIYLLPPERHAEHIYVSQGDLGANNANFVFVAEERRAGETRFNMSRLLIDQTATVFTFNRDMDWTSYEAVLTDDNGAVYQLLLNQNQQMVRDYLAFEPIDLGARGLTLTIASRATGSYALFPIIFEGTIVRLPVFYMNQPQGAFFGDTTFSMMSASFNSFQSHIYYYMDTSIGNLSFDNIFLTQGGTTLPVISNETFNIGNGIVVGRLDFGPLPVAAGNVQLVFANGFNVYGLNQRVSVSSLFRNTLEDRIEIPVRDNTLILERIGRRSEDFVMVLHGTDSEGRRHETRLEAELQVTSGGTQHVLEGQTFSGTLGSDMLFPMTTSIGPNLGSVYLAIERAYFGGTDFTLDISLEHTASGPSFYDGQQINAGREILQGMGYNRVELVTYRVESFYFTGIYRVQAGTDQVRTYRVDRIRTDDGFDSTVQIIG